MSQRWSAIFRATGVWGGKAIGRVRVNNASFTTDQFTGKKTFHRIWWIFSLVHVKCKMKVERSRSFKILALPQFSEQKEFKILESFKNRQNFNSTFFHSTGADHQKEIRSIAKFQFVLRGHTVMITKKTFQNQTKIVRALKR